MSYERNGTAHLSRAEQAAVAAVQNYLSRALRRKNVVQALYIVEQAVINANDTVFGEHARERAEWLEMFVGSAEVLLSERHVSTSFPRVLDAFKVLGITP